MQKSGRFITFEGPDGAGKGTQLARLADYFRAQGKAVRVTREPGGTPLAEELRHIIKHFDGAEIVDDRTELLLFEAARAQHVRNVIAPALANGEIVLCDRFIDSTEAYQGAGRAIDEKKVRALNEYAIGDCRPDLTLLFDLAPEIGLARANARSEAAGHGGEAADRLEREAIDFHRRVRERYLEIARREPERVKVLDATQPVEELFKQVKKLVEL